MNVVNAENVIAVDFRRKMLITRVPPTGPKRSECFARFGLVPLLVSGLYRVVSSVTFALTYWLTSIAWLFTQCL